VGNPNLPLGYDGRGHVYKDWVLIWSGCREGDRIGGNSAIDAPVGRDLATQTTGIHKGEPHQSLACHSQGICADSAKVRAISYGDDAYPMQAGESSTGFNCQATRDLAKGTIPIDTSRHAPLTLNPRAPLGVECTCLNLIDILIHPEGSMRIVPEQA
jgi:hypothetical protein